ncbi:MAG: deaminase [Promicromonosporaceae bacterium]|nr:deaminase [Promicromonosporaceae bacterium]
MPRVSGTPQPRPTWDEWALGLALAVSRRADCSRRQVGAVALAPDRRVLGTGYNGLPSGQPGCATAGACPRGQLGYDAVAAGAPYVGVDAACPALHAEENCILYLSGEDRRGATLYVTDEPCPNCSRLLAGAGFVRVVWPDGEIAF